MKTIFTLYNKKITFMVAAGLLGADRPNRYIEDARQGFMNDPLEEQSWFLGSTGIFAIAFG